MVKKGLGSGVDALFGSMSAPLAQMQEQSGDRVLELKLTDIAANPGQPRRSFEQGKLNELAASIREQGVLQPILVRPAGQSGKYEIVAGERRYRAARLAGLSTIPAIVKELEDKTTLEIALIENIQRQELNPLEEAASYRDLLDNYGYTQAALATRLGKSRVYVANTLRLLGLPSEIQALIAKGGLSAGHGRALLMAEDKADQLLLAEYAKEQGLSVRQTEDLAKNPAALHRATAGRTVKLTSSKPVDKPQDLLLTAVGEKLRERLQTKVSVKQLGKRHGRITLEYYSDEELERLLDMLLPGVTF
ncbi:MAG TPA: ParB/RepB/Spo0J family partition protein [Candidatus Avidehalobacter gallistercoris]|uniref:ParB/RepB/Spo0J family partition protein n=1 Tax=Candidatus Avidehalobacter gallistercoris TaxID=2840694 RepID=A0A9D1KZC2_9FIRM|nr:ParB/RepB/Spo0J family partition protein [Candidatus Avidehalobacter gallistercoris]